MIRCLFLLFILTSTIPLKANEHKTEVKYLVPDLTKLPPDLIKALETGEEHQEILKRGFVVQDYLAVTRKNLFEIYQAITVAGIPFGTQTDFDPFAFPGEMQEIRLMRKSIYEKGSVNEVYQIAIQGKGGISQAKMETPESLDLNELQKIKAIFARFRNEINDRVCKAYFEIPARQPNGNLLLAADGTPRTVEIDIFLKNRKGMITPLFIDGEIKFREADKEKALTAATAFRSSPEKHPAYFGTDVTNRMGFKARNIAQAGVPKDLKGSFEVTLADNELILLDILTQFKKCSFQEIVNDIVFPADQILGSYLNKKILLNAEPFGFGPSAAIAEIFPYLRNRVANLSYIGSGHTLDLQHKLPYDSVFDIGSDRKGSRKEQFKAIARHYDIFITASDFEAAEWAKDLGMTLIIYDPLTWYWSKIPEVIGRADFYVAQNFFRVSERLVNEARAFPDYAIVPSIISGLHDASPNNQETHLLVNMGGLSNPYIRQSDLEAYAKIIFGAARDLLEPDFDQTIYVTSKSIAASVQEVCPAKTLLPHEVQKNLSGSSLAVMTSGLGNIFEASLMEKKVIWLPPANDSQGQQIALLEEHGMVDARIDWSDLFGEDGAIDYFDKQEVVLKKIALLMERLSRETEAQIKLKKAFVESSYKLRNDSPPKLSRLTQTFGADGAKQAADSLLQWLMTH